MINLKTIHARQNSPAKQKITVIHPDNFQQLIPTYFAFISPSKLSPKQNSALKLLSRVFTGYSLVLFVRSSTAAPCIHKKHHKKPHFFFFNYFCLLIEIIMVFLRAVFHHFPHFSHSRWVRSPRTCLGWANNSQCLQHTRGGQHCFTGTVQIVQ